MKNFLIFGFGFIIGIICCYCYYRYSNSNIEHTSEQYLNSILTISNNAKSIISNEKFILSKKQIPFTLAKKFEVKEVLKEGALAVCEEKFHGSSFYNGPTVYILADGENLFYDGQIISVPKSKKAIQIGTFKYLMNTVPVIKFE